MPRTLVSKGWMFLFWAVPIAACAGSAEDGGGNGDDGSGGSSAGSAGASAATGGAAPTGGAGPTGGTNPAGGANQGGAGPTGGTSPGGGVAGTPAGGTGPAGQGGGSGAGMSGAPPGGAGQGGSAAGAGGAGAGAGAGGSAGSAAGSGGAAPACNPRSSCPTCGVDCCPAPTNCAASTATGLIGWASQGGATTGGGNGSPMTVTSSSQLSSALSGSTARVVQFSGSISISNLEIGSNKTLIGTSSTATINGGITIDGASNIILRNFRVNASSSGAGDDGINIQGSDHIWIDHLEIYDADDGNLDITNDSDYITVSWTKFRYSSTGNHNFSNLIGSDDSDSGNYRITFHHNWWGERVDERAPRVRFGDVHVFNNYYSATGNDHCVRAAHQSNVRVESNYFDSVATPHELAEDNGNGILSASNNVYCLSLQTSGAPQTRGSAFTPPYSYTPDPAECVKSLVMAGAGPR